MGTYATSTDVSTLRDTLTGYVSEISYSSDTTTEAALQATAQLQLDLYCDALLAVVNLNAAAAESYANGVGVQVTRRKLREAQSAANTHWDEFVRICGMGGVTVATTQGSVSFWDLSGYNYEY